MMFGVCVMLVLLVPSRLIPLIFPSFHPYNLTLMGSINRGPARADPPPVHPTHAVGAQEL